MEEAHKTLPLVEVILKVMDRHLPKVSEVPNQQADSTSLLEVDSLVVEDRLNLELVAVFLDRQDSHKEHRASAVETLEDLDLEVKRSKNKCL